MSERASQTITFWEVINSRPVLSQVAVLFVGYLVASFGGCVTMPGDVAKQSAALAAEVQTLKAENLQLKDTMSGLKRDLDDMRKTLDSVSLSIARIEGRLMLSNNSGENRK